MINKSVLVLGLSVIVVVLLSLIIFISTGDDEVAPTIKEEQNELKQTFESCEDNEKGEWCCKESWTGDILKERECRQFNE